MESNKWEVVGNHECLLGEGPVWDAARHRILWVDIQPGILHYFYPATQEHKVFEIGQKVGAIAVRENGGVVAALQNGFAFLDLENKTLQWVAQVETELPENRMNDGKCDPAGRFWAGTMSLVNKQGMGNLYMLAPDGTVSLKLPGVSVSNGLAWSPDQSTFYFIDTPTRQVVAYDYEPSKGFLFNKRPVVAIPDALGKPDGMTIDAEGMLWVALWEGWGVGRFDPKTGQLLDHLKLPVARVTSCTFGGPALSDLYITSASIGLSAQQTKEQPLAGSLFVVKNCGFSGLPTPAFKG
ncbi:SMP-30/gluconolactonase/LRE family protein [Rufibacter soli]